MGSKLASPFSDRGYTAEIEAVKLETLDSGEGRRNFDHIQVFAMPVRVGGSNLKYFSGCDSLRKAVF